MREIKSETGKSSVLVFAVDGPGPGGASHHYQILSPDRKLCLGDIRFQDGAILSVGVNGLTHESLLATIVDRLTAFQAGPFACVENAEALAAVQVALVALGKRTARRTAAGIEGTHVAETPVEKEKAPAKK